MRRLSADMHRGQRASLGNQTNLANKAGYKDAADFFTHDTNSSCYSGGISGLYADTLTRMAPSLLDPDLLAAPA